MGAADAGMGTARSMMHGNPATLGTDCLGSDRIGSDQYACLSVGFRQVSQVPRVGVGEELTAWPSAEAIPAPGLGLGRSAGLGSFVNGIDETSHDRDTPEDSHYPLLKERGSRGFTRRSIYTPARLGNP